MSDCNLKIHEDLSVRLVCSSIHQIDQYNFYYFTYERSPLNADSQPVSAFAQILIRSKHNVRLVIIFRAF